jgi:hypothetical protein
MKPTSKKPKETNVEWKTTPLSDFPVKKCDHYFEFVEGGECKCRKCGFGLIGVIDVVDGKPI